MRSCITHNWSENWIKQLASQISCDTEIKLQVKLGTNKTLFSRRRLASTTVPSLFAIVVFPSGSRIEHGITDTMSHKIFLFPVMWCEATVSRIHSIDLSLPLIREVLSFWLFKRLSNMFHCSLFKPLRSLAADSGSSPDGLLDPVATWAALAQAGPPRPRPLFLLFCRELSRPWLAFLVAFDRSPQHSGYPISWKQEDASCPFLLQWVQSIEDLSQLSCDPYAAWTANATGSLRSS